MKLTFSVLMAVFTLAFGIGLVLVAYHPIRQKDGQPSAVARKQLAISSVRQAIVRFLVADRAALNFRAGDVLPYQAWLHESHQLQLIAEIPTVEAITISYSQINLDDLERLRTMNKLHHLCIYGYPHRYEPTLEKNDRLLTIVASLPSLKTLSLGNANELFSLEAILSMLEQLELERFCMFRTTHSYIEGVKYRFPAIYDPSLDIPFDDLGPPVR
jgi:hypothetical protein